MPRSVRRTGVYRITNVVNGKVYVGSASFCLERRMSGHRNSLANGAHHNRHLQRSWNKHGPTCFRFDVLEYCDPEECVRREQFFIDSLSAADPRFGYNISPTAGSNLGIKHTINHRAKTSAALRARVTKPETRAKRSATLLGHPVSPETRAKVAAARLGKPLSPTHREKVGKASKAWWDAHPERRKFSDQHKFRISQAARKRRKTVGRVVRTTQRIFKSRLLKMMKAFLPPKCSTPRVQKTCRCGKEFSVPVRGRRFLQKLCSTECNRMRMFTDNPANLPYPRRNGYT